MKGVQWLLRIVLIIGSIVFTKSQEQPNPAYGTELYNSSAFFRQDLCDRQRALYAGNISLVNALEGLQLHAVLFPSEFFELDNETGAIDEEHPGIMVTLLDEIAKRGKFTWRDTYTIIDRPTFSSGNSSDVVNYTHLLEWSTYTYDISIAQWSAIYSRMAMGINFPEYWHDGSIIMVGDVSAEKSNSNDIFWTWTQPFSVSVWVTILFTIVFSGIVYWALETINYRTDGRKHESDVVENIFLAGLGFTNNFELQPRSNAARLFSFSLSFWAMLTTAAYTANFASFLVVKNQPTLQVATLEEAIGRNLPLCIVNGTLPHTIIEKDFRQANLRLRTSGEEVFRGVLTGECEIAVTTKTTWELFRRNPSVNGNCNLGWVGRPYKSLFSSFAVVSDSGSLCTSLVRDVIHLFTVGMKEDGFFAEAWEDFLSHSGFNCDQQSESVDDSDEVQLKIKNMGGIFFLHLILSLLSFAIAILYKCKGWDKNPRFTKTGPYSRKAVREQLAHCGSSEALSDPSSHSSLAKAAQRRTLAELARASFRPTNPRPSESVSRRKYSTEDFLSSSLSKPMKETSLAPIAESLKQKQKSKNVKSPTTKNPPTTGAPTNTATTTTTAATSPQTTKASLGPIMSTHDVEDSVQSFFNDFEETGDEVDIRDSLRFVNLRLSEQVNAISELKMQMNDLTERSWMKHEENSIADLKNQVSKILHVLEEKKGEF